MQLFTKQTWALPGLLLCLLCAINYLPAQAPALSGELKQWHRITLTFDGPASSETATPNPFTDYALEVTFSQDGRDFVVPGFYAADGDAAETSAGSGNKWRVHFAPDSTGIWTYSVSFKTGTDVAIAGGGNSAGFMDGYSDSIMVLTTDKLIPDNRARGRLTYVGEHYLQYQGSGEWFVKAGADAPENTLAYEDFDAVPNAGNRRKSWQPHQQDYDSLSAHPYTWQNGKGSELLGAVNYLAEKGVNAFSFLTLSIEGDDKNVFPHLLIGDPDDYNGNGQSWENEVHQDRFDVSRLAQWERIFSYADQRGMFLHFKTQETENDQMMDGGAVGRTRQLYYRELIARFSHHLALNWNMGEENTQTDQQRRAMAAYFDQHDPYGHLRVIHTYPGQKEAVYSSLLGDDSEYTGASLQTSNGQYNELFGDALEWVQRSAAAGQKWVVAVDEPGNASIGVDADPDDRKLVRHKVVWATFMAGGAGTEFYYGYQSGCGDLQCQDHRSRDEKYTDAALALDFFQQHFQGFLPAVVNQNELTDDEDDYVLAKGGNAYAVYRPDGGSTVIDLPSGNWEVSWYNPRTGVLAMPIAINNDQLIAPGEDDWTALILPANCAEGLACDDGDACTENDVFDATCNCIGTLVDADQDGVCDAEDQCPGFDDLADTDNDGLPDGCDSCDGNLAGTPCDDGDPATINDQLTTDCDCVGLPEYPPASFYLEAECGERGVAWPANDLAGASAGEMVAAGGSQNFYDAPPNDSAFYLTYRVAVPTAASYAIFLRFIATNDADDSIWFRANCGEWVRWNKMNWPYTQTDWTWEQVSQWDSGDEVTPVFFDLEAGINVFEIALREPNLVLDALYGTPLGDVPLGTNTAFNCGPACTPGVPCDDGDPMTSGERFDDRCYCAPPANDCNLLPVSWGTFTAEPLGADVRLYWSTEVEAGTAFFAVEWMSENGLFREVGRLPALGRAGEYSLVHTDPGAGRHSYRIRQVDLDGQFTYSRIRNVILGTSAGGSLYPNPVIDQAELQLWGAAMRQLELVDIAGRVVKSWPSLAPNTHRLTLSDLPAGVYVLRGMQAGQVWTQRLVLR